MNAKHQEDGMHRFRSHRFGVDRGSIVLFSDYEDGGAMWTGHGPREMRQAVQFAEPFTAAPIVQVSLSMWDMDQKTNQRADISADKIGPEGFEIVFKTWGDTRVARVRADWLAIGDAADEDDWDVP
jgi:quinol monooxygenase YgiN